MTQEEIDYFAARLIEERQAALEASTLKARLAHEQLAAHYEHALSAHTAIAASTRAQSRLK